MFNVTKLIKKLLITLLLSGMVIVLINAFVFGLLLRKSAEPAQSGFTKVQLLTEELYKDASGKYELTPTGEKLLADNQAWAVLVDNATSQTSWRSANIPATIPTAFNLAEIATISRTYLADYPTFIASYGADIVIMGFPEKSYWKLVHNSWNYAVIAQAPQIILLFLVGNLGLIVCIYFFVNKKLIQSIQPIIDGIKRIPNGDISHIKETGALADIIVSINQTGELLNLQKQALARKETARANWIAGVSHDIRTPLSMIMGYAAQLETSAGLSNEDRKKASIITNQSIKVKSLINDLNLASKLEYNMQPLDLKPVRLITVLRENIACFMNQDILEKYLVALHVPKTLACLSIQGDKALLARAFSNLLQNCSIHNPEGCQIWVTVAQTSSSVTITIEDNGLGASEEELEKLNHRQHYLLCDEKIEQQRHGLGLLIVEQIIKNHHGQVSYSSSEAGGFKVKIELQTVAEQTAAKT